MKGWRQPTRQERAALTRIYGDEENWLGVSTDATKQRRAKVLGEQRRKADA